MPGTRNKTRKGAEPLRRTVAPPAGAGYAAVEGESGREARKKKNVRLHQSKIDEAKEILGTATETETIEAALDLVVFRKELMEGVRAMRGAKLVNLFGGTDP